MTETQTTEQYVTKAIAERRADADAAERKIEQLLDDDQVDLALAVEDNIRARLVADILAELLDSLRAGETPELMIETIASNF